LVPALVVVDAGNGRHTAAEELAARAEGQLKLPLECGATSEYAEGRVSYWISIVCLRRGLLPVGIAWLRWRVVPLGRGVVVAVAGLGWPGIEEEVSLSSRIVVMLPLRGRDAGEGVARVVAPLLVLGLRRGCAVASAVVSRIARHVRDDGVERDN
jgi:hypothetical protein